jgi:hypothetical protein
VKDIFYAEENQYKCSTVREYSDNESVNADDIEDVTE